MANYTGPDPNRLLAGEPWTSDLALAAFEDPLAIAEGATGAPKVRGVALDIDGTEIGSFIFARGPSTTAFGDVVAGSSLTYAGALSSATTSTDSGTSVSSFSFNAGANGTPSGSWRCLGRIELTATAVPSKGTGATAATLWQRVA